MVRRYVMIYRVGDMTFYDVIYTLTLFLEDNYEFFNKNGVEYIPRFDATKKGYMIYLRKKQGRIVNKKDGKLKLYYGSLASFRIASKDVVEYIKLNERIIDEWLSERGIENNVIRGFHIKTIERMCSDFIESLRKYNKVIIIRKRILKEDKNDL